MRPNYKRGQTDLQQPTLVVKPEPLPTPGIPDEISVPISPRVSRRRVAKKELYSPEAFLDSKSKFSLYLIHIARNLHAPFESPYEDVDPDDSESISISLCNKEIS